MNHRKKKYESQLARRISLQYVAAIIIFCLLYIGLFFFALTIYQSIIWDAQSLIYRLVQFVKEYFPVFFAAPLLAGWIIITYFSIARPIRYVDEVVSAAKELTVQNETPVVLRAELKEVQDELNLVREQAYQNALLAKEAEQRKSDLIVYLAHDLKTPLASVIGYLNLLHDEGQISEELRERYLSITLDKAERLEDLINEFFEIARFNLSNITLQYSRINLTMLLEQLIFEFKPMLKEKNLNCSLSIENNVMLRCDADKIQRVFDNLLRNAVIYSFYDTNIHITAVEMDGNMVIQFQNYGDTIPGEKLERIFEQFYRLDTSRSTSSGGAGLGLAIAKQIVELHRGTITAKSHDDQIEFTVILPVS